MPKSSESLLLNVMVDCSCLHIMFSNLGVTDLVLYFYDTCMVNVKTAAEEVHQYALATLLRSGTYCPVQQDDIFCIYKQDFTVL